MPEIVASELVLHRGGREALAASTFTIPNGVITAVIGPNGSGKSSLLRLMAGLGAPAAGEIAWHDIAVGDDRLLHGERIHYLGHRNEIGRAHV